MAKTQKQLRHSCCNSFMVRPWLQQILKTGFDAVVPVGTLQPQGSNLLGLLCGELHVSRCVCVGYVHILLPQSKNRGGQVS